MKSRIMIFAFTALFLMGCEMPVTSAPGPVITGVPAVEKDQPKATGATLR